MNFSGRTNILVEPTTSDGSLVVALHGGLGTPVGFQSKLRLEDVFPESYIIYADAKDSNNNVWQCGGIHGDSDEDIAYLQSLISQIKREYPEIDSENIHLIGYSNGGMMAYRLASYLDEANYKSVTVIAGTYLAPEEFDYDGPVFHIHGSMDNMVPVTGNDNYPALSATIDIIKDSALRLRVQYVRDAVHTLDSIKREYPQMLTDIKNHMGF